MKQSENESSALTIFIWILPVLGVYCFLNLLARVDTSEELQFKRMCAFSFVLIWPLLYVLSEIRAKRDKGKTLAVGITIILLVSWAIAAYLMKFEYGRMTNPENIYKPFGI